MNITHISQMEEVETVVVWSDYCWVMRVYSSLISQTCSVDFCEHEDICGL